jgi:osmotically-inducible protein OsmY
MRAAAIVVFLSFCSLLFPQATPRTGPPHARPPAAAAAPKKTDAQIQAEIQRRLAKSKIGKNGFVFKTSGGVVTIEGKASVVQHKGAATRLAKSSGAAAVVNKIQISEEARKAARDKLDKGRRRVQVKRGEARGQPR